jgi:hypothetical protein
MMRVQHALLAHFDKRERQPKGFGSEEMQDGKKHQVITAGAGGTTRDQAGSTVTQCTERAISDGSLREQ